MNFHAEEQFFNEHDRKSEDKGKLTVKSIEVKGS